MAAQLTPEDRQLLRRLKTPESPLFRLSTTPPLARKKKPTQAEILDFWRECFFEAEADDWDLFPFRVKAAWRIVRDLAWSRGYLTPESFLSEIARFVSPDPWIVPCLAMSNAPLPIVGEGMTLLPPPAPMEPDYSPLNDRGLLVYTEVVKSIALRLGIFRTQEGRLGIEGFLHPKTCRQAFRGITPSVIFAFEMLFVREALDEITHPEKGETLTGLRERHGLSADEVKQLHAMARRIAPDEIPIDREIDRHLMVRRLDRLLEDASMKAPLDARIKVQIFRLQAVLRGLWHQDGEGSLASELSEVAERALNEIPPAPLPAPRLPAPQEE